MCSSVYRSKLSVLSRFCAIHRHLRGKCRVCVSSPLVMYSSGHNTSDETAVDADDVLLEVTGDKAVITLNRPRVHNALNMSMVAKILPALRSWQRSDSGIKLVILKGSGGKAFCAGGDVRALAAAGLSHHPLAQDCIITEYTTINTIGNYRLPVVSLIDGITMGAGAGISVNGMFQVATERTIFSMPETVIDVGASYFLSRLPGHVGVYLGLTSERITGWDMYRIGLASHLITSDKVRELECELMHLTDPDVSRVKTLLDTYHQQCSVSFHDVHSETGLSAHISDIDSMFSGTTIQHIMDTLSSHAHSSQWARKQLETLNKLPPTSLVVTLNQIRAGASLSTLADCLIMEYRIIQRFFDPRIHKDFFEGVRAAVIDKDNQPRWNPPTVDQVDIECVRGFFEPLPPPLHELEL